METQTLTLANILKVGIKNREANFVYKTYKTKNKYMK